MAFRRGQWVTLTQPVEVIAAVVDGEPIKKTLAPGTLGIHHPLDDDREYQHASGFPMRAVSKMGNPDNPDDPNDVIRNRNFPDHFTGFHQVAQDGMETLRVVAVDPSVLAPVTDRNQIPERRLSTMDPDWTPRP